MCLFKPISPSLTVISIISRVIASLIQNFIEHTLKCYLRSLYELLSIPSEVFIIKNYLGKTYWNSRESIFSFTFIHMSHKYKHIFFYLYCSNKKILYIANSELIYRGGKKLLLFNSRNIKHLSTKNSDTAYGKVIYGVEVPTKQMMLFYVYICSTHIHITIIISAFRSAHFRKPYIYLL